MSARFFERLTAVTFALAMLAFAACGSGIDGPTQPADLVLLNGKIITVDAADRIAQAVAVRDGRIVAVGTDQEVERFVGPETRRIDLEG